MDESSPRSRRWFLAAGFAVLGGGAAGAGTAVLRTHPRRRPRGRTPPGELVAAVRAERLLIADLDATTGGTPAVRGVLAQARADHASHLRVVSQLVARYGGSTAAPSAVPSAAVTGTARTAAQLRTAELRAASDAATRAAALHGSAAALLASIAAAEATHAELLR